MLHTVITPLDGSKLAEMAIGPATALARRAGAELVLTTVTSRVGLVQHSTYLTELADGVDFPCRTEVLLDGDPSTAILQLAQRSTVAIICMSSHGRGRVSQTLLGGVSAAVVRQGTLPVVVVGPHCLPAPTVYEELVVPVDASAISVAILPLASAWAGALDMRIQLVQVVDPDAAQQMVDAGVQASDVNEESYVAGVAADLRDQGLAASWEVLHDLHPARAITAFAADRRAAMVAMTTHGRSGISFFALGSVATRVVHDGSCPVLLLRPQLPFASAGSHA